MNNRQNGKRAVETFLVGSASEAYYNTAGAGDALTDPADSSIVLAPNQLGLFASIGVGTTDMYTALPVAPDTDDSNVISIFQGTSSSATPGVNPYGYPLVQRIYEKSPDFVATESITATRQDYQAPKFSTYIIGGPAGAFNPQDLTAYTLKIALRGEFMDELVDNTSTATAIVNVDTPDFTSLGTADTTDWLVQNLAFRINRYSRELKLNQPHLQGNYPVVAFALDTTGAAGTGADTLTPGFLGLVNTAYGIKGITLNANQIASIQAGLAEASFPATTGIMTVDLTTAGTLTGNAVMIQALDREPAYLDDKKSVKARIQVGLTTGFQFNTVYSAEVEPAFEGEGTYRQLNTEYRLTHGQRKYSNLHEEFPMIEYPTPFTEGVNYHQLRIVSETSNLPSEQGISVSPQETIVAVPTAGVASLDALVTAFNSWLASAGQSAVKLYS